MKRKVLDNMQIAEEEKSERRKEQNQIGNSNPLLILVLEKLDHDKELLLKKLKGVGALQEVF